MLELIGLAIIGVVVIAVIVIARKNRPSGLDFLLAGLLGDRKGRLEDPVQAAAVCMAAESQRLGDVLYIPTYLAIRVPNGVAQLIRSDPFTFRESIAAAANSQMQKRSHREGVEAPELMAASLTVLVHDGPFAVRAAFEPWTGEAFASVPVGPQTGRARTGTSANSGNDDRRPPRMGDFTSPTLPRTVDPRDVSDEIITTTLPGQVDIDTAVPQGDEPKSLKWGRNPTCDVALPEVAGISEFHVEITSFAGFLYAVDRSTFGTWLWSDGRWARLELGEPTRLAAGARLSLNERRTVTLLVGVKA